jgi:hypothetical protein
MARPFGGHAKAEGGGGIFAGIHGICWVGGKRYQISKLDEIAKLFFGKVGGRPVCSVMMWYEVV